MKLPRSRHSLLATALVVAAFCAPQVGSIASQPLAPAPKASASIAVRAAGRGNPYVNLGDAVGLLPRYSGHRAAAAQLEAGTARPLALATADFDKDGVPDVIASWEAAGSSSVSLHRASFDARHPYSEQARRHREEGTFVGERFMPEAAVFEIPEPAELMAAGDFDADGNQDLAAASRHAKSLTVLHGDGAGGFRPPESLELPGTLTALAAVDFNRRDGYEDLLAAVVGPDGARLLVYQSYEGALQAEPEAIPLPAPATAIAIGRLDTHPLRDLVVTAGDRLVLVPGRDRRLYATGRIREQADKLSVQEVELPGPAESVAVGDFDGDVKDDIAVRLAGGVLWVRLAADPDKPQSMSLPGGPAEGENAARLVTAAVSSRPGRSLLLMEPSARRLRLLMPEKGGPAPEPIDLEVAGRPVAVLPIYLNGDGLSDLVVLSEAPASLSVSESMPLTTLTVTTVGDLGLGT
ncbi:MAG: FG-GAP repeat domain-containing protein, partial [Candidatus Polarisedimenticolia bacterium]